ncbi:MAG: hypothetical protein M1835_006824 [Candelina submexicana]|nr:MAG: hypothetical protein M1835_006824 [Candelina submexicana]
MGQLDRARSECEKALQARRRLLGKRSDASLKSTALMAHICVLLNNRAWAKSSLAMIPEARRDAVIKIVEKSLGTKMGHHGSPSLLSRSISGDSNLDLAVPRIDSGLYAPSSTSPMEDRCYGPVSATMSQSQGAGLQQFRDRNPSEKAGMDDTRFVTMAPRSSAEKRAESQALGAAAPSLAKSLETNEISEAKTLSRKEILHRLGCQPKDQIEDAVCDGGHSAIASLLNRKDVFLRSKLRKHVRPERATVLHFAARFAEIDMARHLLDSEFRINETPFGYAASLTPLKFAIGARQVDMVELLVASGAKPSELVSWSTLAGLLMNCSLFTKTLSEPEKEDVPDRIISILRILLKHRLDVNTPFETSGKTVLHQAVTFWMGSDAWDMSLRTAATSFLCEQGADPSKANTEGKTSYDLASASGHHDLLLFRDRGSRETRLVGGPAELVELSAERETNSQEGYRARIGIGLKKDWIRRKVKMGR